MKKLPSIEGCAAIVGMLALASLPISILMWRVTAHMSDRTADFVLQMSVVGAFVVVPIFLFLAAGITYLIYDRKSDRQERRDMLGSQRVPSIRMEPHYGGLPLLEDSVESQPFQGMSGPMDYLPVAEDEWQQM